MPNPSELQVITAHQPANDFPFTVTRFACSHTMGYKGKRAPKCGCFCCLAYFLTGKDARR